MPCQYNMDMGPTYYKDYRPQAQKPFSLVFGNEQSGLPAVFQTYGQSVFIPQSDKIDSLNLSVAVSIGAYAFRQKEEF